MVNGLEANGLFARRGLGVTCDFENEQEVNAKQALINAARRNHKTIRCCCRGWDWFIGSQSYASYGFKDKCPMDVSTSLVLTAHLWIVSSSLYMSNATLSIDQLKRAIVIQENIDKLEAELRAVLSSVASSAATVQAFPVPKPVKKKRKMSAAGRANIIAAQKTRWDKINGAKAAAPGQHTPAPKAAKKKAKRNISPEARAKMAAAAKALGKGEEVRIRRTTPEFHQPK